MTPSDSDCAALASSHRSSPRRLQTLNETGLLESGLLETGLLERGNENKPSEDLDTLTALVCRLLEVPIALVTLVADNRQVFASQVGLTDPWATLGQTPLSHSFCQYTLGSVEPLLVEDARVRPLVEHNGAIADLGVVAYAGVPLILENGETLGALCAIDSQPRTWSEADVSLLRRLARLASDQLSLKRALRLEERRVREREALLTLAAHELRNPLAVLIGMGELLEEHPAEAPLGESGRELVGHLRPAGTRIHDLLGRILDTAAFERGGLILKKEPFDFSALVRRVVEEMGRGVQRHTLRLTGEHSEVRLEGDAVRLEQVLRNLLSNTLKYSPQGGAVTVHLQQTLAECCLEVRDQGLGIPRAALGTLFERFSRVRGGESEGLGGLGLGLYVVEQVIQGHGGRVEVESTPGVGSAFRVCLPLSGVAE